MSVVNGETIHTKGSLLLFLADTLAAHQIGGFKIGVGFSFRKCRNCLTTADEMEGNVSNHFIYCVFMHVLLKQYRHNAFQLRTPELHEYQCSLLKGPLASFNSTTHGVNYRGILNDIPLFNVADWQLPQDVMHVLLEGVLPLEIKLLLHHFIIIKKLFTLHHFNVRLNSFIFGYTCTKSKPSKIDENHLIDGNLHQSGKIKIFCFLINLFIYCSISVLDTW